MADLAGMDRAARKAYEAAQRLIAKTIRKGGTEISFDDEAFRALTQIPPEIADIKGLTSLNLDRTKVSDLSPIRNLTGLRSLWLNHTGVSDLSPIRNLTGLQILDLDQTGVSDLSPIRDLTGLRSLYLSHTGVSDLFPIRGLTGLQILWLNQTGVSDLRHLIHMDQLGDGPIGGLSFFDTPAVQHDPKLARLSEIDDDAQRAKETIAYLKTLPPWPEPLPWLSGDSTKGTPPDQDPALPLIWGEKGFSFLANSIDSDPVTEAALEDLRDLLEDLRRKGNRHDDLYRLASELQDRTKGEVRDLNLVKLHISYQKLQRLYRSRDQRIEKFDDETVGTLDSVLGILPGVTMADPGVAELIERQEKDRLAGSLPETAQAEEGVLRAVQDKDAPFDDGVKDTAKAVLEPGQNDRLAGTRSILARNSLIALLRFLRYDPIGAGLSTAAVVLFAQSHGPTLLAMAQTMGIDAFTWAQAVLASLGREAEVTMGIAREGLTSGVIKLPRRNKPEQ